MHHPVGYRIENGQALLTSFSAVVFNYKAWLFTFHVNGSCVDDRGLLRAGDQRLPPAPSRRTSTCSPARCGSGWCSPRSGRVLSASSGHLAAQADVCDQPMKFAAMEAQWEDSESPAPWSAIALDQRAGAAQRGQPGDPADLGSLLAYNNIEGSYRGMNSAERGVPADATVRANYIPPVAAGVLVVPDHGGHRDAAAAHRLRRAVPVVASARRARRDALVPARPGLDACRCRGWPTSSAGSPPRWAASRSWSTACSRSSRG